MESLAFSHLVVDDSLEGEHSFMSLLNRVSSMQPYPDYLHNFPADYPNTFDGNEGYVDFPGQHATSSHSSLHQSDDADCTYEPAFLPESPTEDIVQHQKSQMLAYRHNALSSNHLQMLWFVQYQKAAILSPEEAVLMAKLVMWLDIQVLYLANVDLGIFNLSQSVLPRTSAFDQDTLRRMIIMATDVGAPSPSFSSAPLRHKNLVCYSRSMLGDEETPKGKGSRSGWQSTPIANNASVLTPNNPAQQSVKQNAQPLAYATIKTSCVQWITITTSGSGT